MPTLQDCIKLSMAVYDLSEVENWDLKDTINGNVINDNGSSNRGFRAALYVESYRQKAVIAFAGVDFLKSDYVFDNSAHSNWELRTSMLNSIKEELGATGVCYKSIKEVEPDSPKKRIVEQLNSAETFYKFIREKYPRYKFTAVGNSLGGVCAAYISSKHDVVDSYTINAPQTDTIYGITFARDKAKERIHRYYVICDYIARLPKNGPEDPILEFAKGCILNGIIYEFFD